MSPEEQRWKIHGIAGNNSDPKCWCNYGRSNTGHTDWTKLEIPDYLGDLNAMREATGTMTSEDQQECFCQELAIILGIIEGTVLWSTQEDWKMLHATAAQWAKAFVLTMEPE